MIIVASSAALSSRKSYMAPRDSSTQLMPEHNERSLVPLQDPDEELQIVLRVAMVQVEHRDEKSAVAVMEPSQA